MKWAFFCSLAASLLIVGQAAEARILGEHSGFVASVPDNFSCARAVTVRINGPSRNAFQDKAAELAKVVGLIRIAMSFECPGVKEITLDGYLAADKVATAKVSAAANWRLGAFQPVRGSGSGTAIARSGEAPVRGGGGSTGRPPAHQTTAAAPKTVRPSWSSRDVPILKGSVAENPARYPKLDLSQIPVFKGYELVPLKPVVCARQLTFGIVDRDGRGLGRQNDDLSEAIRYFGLYLSDPVRCPLLETLGVRCKPACEGRSGFAVKRRHNWHTMHVLNRIEKEKVAHRQKVVQAYQNRPLPTPSTENPLGSRGYFASSFVAQIGNVSLYEAYQVESKFYRRGAIFVMVHDVQPDDPIVRLTYDSFHGTYRTVRDFAEMVDTFVEYPSYRSAAPHNIRHYVKGHARTQKMQNSTHSRNIEVPLISTSGRKFTIPYSPNYAGKSVYENDLEVSLSDLTGAR